MLCFKFWRRRLATLIYEAKFVFLGQPLEERAFEAEMGLYIYRNLAVHPSTVGLNSRVETIGKTSQAWSWEI